MEERLEIDETMRLPPEDYQGLLWRRVDVYWHSRLQRWTIRDHRTKKVLGHSHFIALRDCIFTVQRAGRERFRQTGIKNVHAWVTGRLVALDARDVVGFVGGQDGQERRATVVYHPLADDHFTVKGRVLGKNVPAHVWSANQVVCARQRLREDASDPEKITGWRSYCAIDYSEWGPLV